MAGHRYRFYVDGFNVYHALFPWFPQYLWLNYWKLAQSAVYAEDSVCSVTYFSAYADWKPEKKVQKHREYISLLESAGVQVIMGRFKEKEKPCDKLKDLCRQHEEKRTDVNIAVTVLCDAIRGKHDRSVIVSADTDLIPVIAAVRGMAPAVKVGVMTPLLRDNKELLDAADFPRRMSERILARSQFPPDVKLGNAGIRRPDYETQAADWIKAHPWVKDPRPHRGGLDS